MKSRWFRVRLRGSDLLIVAKGQKRAEGGKLYEDTKERKRKETSVPPKGLDGNERK